MTSYPFSQLCKILFTEKKKLLLLRILKGSFYWTVQRNVCSSYALPVCHPSLFSHKASSSHTILFWVYILQQYPHLVPMYLSLTTVTMETQFPLVFSVTDLITLCFSPGLPQPNIFFVSERFFSYYSLCNLALTSIYLRQVCSSLLETKGCVTLQWQRTKRGSDTKASKWEIAYNRWFFR